MDRLFLALADLVALLHFLFVLFVVLGGLLVLKWKWVRWLHLPAALWGAMIEFTGWICPLTPIEYWLRELGGGQGYQFGFIEHYLMPILYPAGLTPDHQMLLGVFVVVVNVGIYGWVFYRWKACSTWKG